MTEKNMLFTINEELQKEIKVYCAKNNIKIRDLMKELIQSFLKSNLSIEDYLKFKAKK